MSSKNTLYQNPAMIFCILRTSGSPQPSSTANVGPVGCGDVWDRWRRLMRTSRSGFLIKSILPRSTWRVERWLHTQGRDPVAVPPCCHYDPTPTHTLLRLHHSLISPISSWFLFLPLTSLVLTPCSKLLLSSFVISLYLYFRTFSLPVLFFRSSLVLSYSYVSLTKLYFWPLHVSTYLTSSICIFYWLYLTSSVWGSLWTFSIWLLSVLLLSSPHTHTHTHTLFFSACLLILWLSTGRGYFAPQLSSWFQSERKTQTQGTLPAWDTRLSTLKLCMCVCLCVCMCMCLLKPSHPPPSPCSLCLATENWNNLVSAASGLLFGWQGSLVGQAGLLQDNREIYGQKERNREWERWGNSGVRLC